MDAPVIPEVSPAVQASFEPVMKVISAVRGQLSDIKEVVAIRPGYKYPPAGQPVPAIVVAVAPGIGPVKAAELEAKFGVPSSLHDATIEERAAAEHQQPISFGTPAGSTVSAFEKMLGGDAPLAFAPPKTGSYQEPNPPDLPLVKESMELTICVSPEAGWSELESFL